ncbi:GNAT family N-acetyltransferase [Euzebya pacifica]|uniref:GNAT family N-acetyltransferase n=1 Tax=Euzebya pacifica TaxID=1608957 RepID=UPI0030F7102B
MSDGPLREEPGTGVASDHHLIAPTLRTDRLRMVAFAERHLEPFTRIQYDPRVAEWYGGLPDPPHEWSTQLEQTWRVMAMFAGHWVLRGFGQWAVEDAETGDLLGRVGLWQPEGWPGIEVGWLVHPDRWGRGYATEAARTAVEWGFTSLGLDRIISVTVPHNTRSQQVMRKVGLTDTGTTVEVGGHEQVLFAVTNQEWSTR